MQELTTRQDGPPTRPTDSTVRVDPRDPLGLAPDAPLFAAYLECLDRFDAGEAPFQTPGHKGSTALTGVTVAGDHPLAGGLDTIKLTHGTLIDAERRAADAYGASFCRLSTGGSTHCNQAIAMSIGAPGDEVVVARTLHRSLLLGLVLAGLEPVWVEPQVSRETGLALGYDPETVAQALRAHPRARAVLLTDPSYVGTCSDLSAHAEVAHGAGVPLIVDAAWAAHFGFHPALPPHAIGAGADAMVTSAHKTLPAYSQGALLLARTERLDASRMTRAFEALATTSPAGAILASVDAARALLVRDGEAMLERTIVAVAAARSRLREIDGLRVLDGPLVDPVKLTVSLAGTGAHGVAIEQDLADAGVPVELADRDTIVALVTLADEPAAIERLTEALANSIERRRGTPRTINDAAGWIVSPLAKVSPREAFFGEVETVAFSHAAGRVSAELIALYPPGVPVLAPGEEITERALTSLSEAAQDGVRVAYANDPTLATIQVLA
jgi:arginine decarboxylase